jgi:hypothetical protein
MQKIYLCMIFNYYEKLSKIYDLFYMKHLLVYKFAKELNETVDVIVSNLIDSKYHVSY